MIKPFQKLIPAFVLALLSACASKPSSGGKGPIIRPHTETGSAETNKVPPVETPKVTEEADKKDAVSVGVWVDAAGVEAFAALGFLQGLEKSQKIKVSKVIGTGLGCWVATSWALEASSNRAEWQATKLDSWEALVKGGLLKRLSGSRADFTSFRSAMARLLPASEFRTLARESDCPLMNARTGVLESARNFGIYKTLWIQMTTPLLGFDDEFASMNQFSGVLGIRPRPRELDDFSALEKSSKEVQAWIVLSLDTMSILAEERDELRDALLKRFVDSTQGASVSPEGRPIYVTVPAFDVNVKSARDFSQRRNFLLQGRKYAERFLSNPWLDRIQDSGNGLEADPAR